MVDQEKCCESKGRAPHLQEARDVPLVVDAHGDHVLEHPEERPVLPFFGLGLAQQAVELEEQPPCAFWRGETINQTKVHQAEPSLR